MPSLIRFIVFCAILAGIAYGAMFALVTYVEPQPKEVLIKIPANKLNLE
jgi:hypothetical protein